MTCKWRNMKEDERQRCIWEGMPVHNTWPFLKASLSLWHSMQQDTHIIQSLAHKCISLPVLDNLNRPKIFIRLFVIVLQAGRKNARGLQRLSIYPPPKKPEALNDCYIRSFSLLVLSECTITQICLSQQRIGMSFRTDNCGRPNASL